MHIQEIWKFHALSRILLLLSLFSIFRSEAPFLNISQRFSTEKYQLIFWGQVKKTKFPVSSYYHIYG